MSKELNTDRKSITISKKVGTCGSIYCIFIEGTDGEFHKLLIKGAGREIPCSESWLQPIGKLLTFALRRSLYEGTTDNAILKHLKGHRCNSLPPNADHVSSCSDAIAKCVAEYLEKCSIITKSPSEINK